MDLQGLSIVHYLVDHIGDLSVHHWPSLMIIKSQHHIKTGRQYSSVLCTNRLYFNITTYIYVSCSNSLPVLPPSLGLHEERQGSPSCPSCHQSPPPSPDQLQTYSAIFKVLIDSISASLFENILLSWQTLFVSPSFSWSASNIFCNLQSPHGQYFRLTIWKYFVELINTICLPLHLLVSFEHILQSSKS